MFILFGTNTRAEEYGDYEYRIKKNGNIEITNYYGDAKKLTIPSIINGRKVTSLGETAFYGKDIKSIYVPNTVKTIACKAFCYCSNLTKIHLPEKIKTLGDCAFFDCGRLKSINMPKTLVKIGESSFEYCENLRRITIPKNVKTIGRNAFGHCKRLKKIIIKTKKLNRNRVGGYAFNGIYKKATFYLPKSKKAAYKKILLKRGAKKTMKYMTN